MVKPFFGADWSQYTPEEFDRVHQILSKELSAAELTTLQHQFKIIFAQDKVSREDIVTVLLADVPTNELLESINRFRETGR
jgi:hypothetical protein